MTATATRQDNEVIDFDSLEAHARRKIQDAEAAEARLSLDALSSPEMESELRDVQSERAAAENLLRQTELARGECQRREEVEKEAAEQQAREKALADADAVDGPLLTAARKVDRLADQLAQAIATHRRLTAERSDLRQRAGVEGAPQGFGWGMTPAEAAVRRALAAHGCESAFDFQVRWPGHPLEALAKPEKGASNA
jgi:hypothetical protein